MHERLPHEPPRWNDVGSSESRKDVVEPQDIGRVQDHELELYGNRDLLEVVADLEVDDRPRLDPVRIETCPGVVEVDVRNREGVVRVADEVRRPDVGDEPGVVPDV